MAHLLNIVKQQQQALIDEEKLRTLCLQHNILDHFGVAREEFSAFSEVKQMQLLKKFYFDLVPILSTSAMNASSSHIDSRSGSAIKNSSSIRMTKVIENGADRSEFTISTTQNEEGVKKSINLWPNFGYFGTESYVFSIEKRNLPENTNFYVNQGYQSCKDGKKVYYRDVFIIAQIMLLAHQPADVESYMLKEDEVKILRSRYNPVSGDFLGIKYCVSTVTVCNNPQEQFFDYGCNKDKAKVLYCTQKLKMPNSFKMTIFSQHRMQYEGGAFNTQDFSQIYFYLPSTVNGNEKINMYMTSVNLKSFTISYTKFGDQFNPADLDFNRSVMVELMKKVALQSSTEFKKERRCFFIYCDTRQQQAALTRRKKDSERKIRPHILNTY